MSSPTENKKKFLLPVFLIAVLTIASFALVMPHVSAQNTTDQENNDNMTGSSDNSTTVNPTTPLENNDNTTLTAPSENNTMSAPEGNTMNTQDNNTLTAPSENNNTLTAPSEINNTLTENNNTNANTNNNFINNTNTNTNINNVQVTQQVVGTVKVNNNQKVENFSEANLKVKHDRAEEAAKTHFREGKVIDSHLSIINDYLVYTVVVVHLQFNTVNILYVDAGDGNILYISPPIPADHEDISIVRNNVCDCNCDNGKDHTRHHNWP
jgi:uncharacterized membrane protein YkoI